MYSYDRYVNRFYGRSAEVKFNEIGATAIAFNLIEPHAKERGSNVCFVPENPVLVSNTALFLDFSAVLKTLFHGIGQKSAARSYFF